MSFYTAGIRTHYIDPINHIGNVRSEFRLDSGKVYLSNWRLCNLGTVATANNAGVSKFNGVAGLIKNIRLLDGATTLSQFRDYNDYVAWVNLQHSNSANSSVYSKLLHNANGMRAKFSANGDNYARTNAQENLSSLGGWWSVRDAVSMLGAVSYIPTTVFKDLKLVIEWNNRIVDISVNQLTTIDNSNFRPILVVDEVLNEQTKAQMLGSFNNVSWNEIEKDIMVIDAVAGFGTNTGAVVDAPQKVEKRLNGFNNKKVGKVLFKNRSEDAGDITANIVQGGGASGSKTQLNQKVNIRVNGVPMFSFDGVDNDGFRLALLNDMFGAFNLYAGGNILRLGAEGLATNNTGNNGRLDYFGVDLGGQEVRDLNITYERTNSEDSNSRFSTAMEIQLYGEVAKNLSVMGNSYVVSYA